MAGWTCYNEHTGEIETGMYERPFIVRGKSKHPLTEDTTITAFRSLVEAEEWVARNEENYTGKYGDLSSLHIENWNADEPAKSNLGEWITDMNGKVVAHVDEVGPEGYVMDGADGGL